MEPVGLTIDGADGFFRLVSRSLDEMILFSVVVAREREKKKRRIRRIAPEIVQ
jgi:hypothetical protein